MKPTQTQKYQRTVSIRCNQCGDIDQITDRSLRRKTAEGRIHLCRTCKAVQAIKPSEEDRTFWTSRFSQKEIDDMVSAILG